MTSDPRANVNITFVPIDGSIGVNGQILLNIPQEKFSHLSRGIAAFHWYADVQRGEIEFSHHPLDPKRNNELIDELGDWAELVDIWEEQTLLNEEEEKRIQEYIEASRDYWAELRDLRAYKLLSCDWTQLPNASLTEEQKAAWEVYRQALRDLPDTIEDPKPLVKDENHPDWPIPPSK